MKTMNGIKIKEMTEKQKRSFEQARRHPCYWLEGIDIEIGERLWTLQRRKKVINQKGLDDGFTDVQIRELKRILKFVRAESDRAAKQVQ